MEMLSTPFLPARDKHPKHYMNCLHNLDDTTMINHRERQALVAILSYTTNPELLKGFKLLNCDDLRELALFSIDSLWNIHILDKQRGREHLRLTYDEFNKMPEMPLSTDTLRSLGITNLLPERPTGLTKLSPDHTPTEREADICMVTGTPQNGKGSITWLFPYYTLDFTRSYNLLIWVFLVIFLGEDMRDHLARELISEEEGVRTLANGIHMDLCRRWDFDVGDIGLIPYRRPRKNPNYLDVKFVRYTANWRTGRLLANYPKDPEEQYAFNKDGTGTRVQAEEPHTLEDGDIIRIGSALKNTPLPSSLLLFWHQHLWRVASIAGVIVDDEYEDYGFEATTTEYPEASELSKQRKALEDERVLRWYQAGVEIEIGRAERQKEACGIQEAVKSLRNQYAEY
ncbi:hypothetical protein TWF281_002804 [Arthrobotrys megalospora]